MAEQAFLNERDVYVSNTRVVIHGTTYSTANITSVRKTITPATTGCATLMIILGAFVVFAGLLAMFGSDASDVAVPLVFGLAFLGGGIAWFRSQRPTYHVMLATAAGERQGLSSQDETLVNRVTHAVADAMTFRG